MVCCKNLLIALFFISTALHSSQPKMSAEQALWNLWDDGAERVTATKIHSSIAAGCAEAACAEADFDLDAACYDASQCEESRNYPDGVKLWSHAQPAPWLHKLIERNAGCDAIKALLDNGANPNVRDSQQQTPLAAVVNSYPYPYGKQSQRIYCLQVATVLLQHPKIELRPEMPLKGALFGGAFAMANLLTIRRIEAGEGGFDLDKALEVAKGCLHTQRVDREGRIRHFPGDPDWYTSVENFYSRLLNYKNDISCKVEKDSAAIVFEYLNLAASKKPDASSATIKEVPSGSAGSAAAAK